VKKQILFFFIFSINLFVNTDIALSWSVKTHEHISEKAIEASQLNSYLKNNLAIDFYIEKFSGPAHSKDKKDLIEFADDENYIVTEWIIHGAGAEDEFFDAWINRGNLVKKDMRSIKEIRRWQER
jgi:hypothetical protein